MARDSFRVKNSVNIQPSASQGTSPAAGDLRVDSADGNKLKHYDGTNERAVIRAGDASIVNADINASAGIDASKMADGTVSNAEFQYLNGVTSAIQTQIDGKQATITGAATTITSSDLTASRALASDGSGKVAASSVTATELGYVSGVTSAVQTQLDNKVAKVTATDNAVTRFDGTTGAVQNSGVIVDDSNNISGANNLSATGTTINLGTSNTASTINIGTGTDINTINIGGANTVVNITGSSNVQNVTNLEVSDKLITINNGGAAASGAVAGIEVEENNVATGYVYTSADRNSWQLKAPNTAGIATLTPGASNDDVVLRQATQTLTNKSISGSTNTITNVSLSTGVTGTLPILNGGTGQTTANAALNALLPSQTSNTNKVLKTDGTNTSWASAGGGTGKNYAQDLYDGSSVTGINRYADAAATTPVDGTGGSPNVSAAALNTSTPLRGTSSQRLSKDAANRQGEGWSYDFTLDKADYEGGKPVIVSFRYKTSAAYANGDIRMFVYDRDGTTLLNVLSLTGDGSINASTSTTRYTGAFYPNSSNNDYRLIFHITSTNASAYDLDLIDLSIGPDQVVPGAIQANLGTESWTDSEANSTTSVSLTRIGRRVFVKGTTTVTGAFSGSGFSVTIPSTYTPDSTEYVSPGILRAYNTGFATFVDTGTTSSEGISRITGASTLRLDLLNASSTYAATSSIGATTPHTWASGDFIEWSASWIVSGWAESAALSTTETMLSAVKVRATTSSTTVSGSAATIVYTTETHDTHSSYDNSTGIFTAPKSGYYTFSASLLVTATWSATNSAAIYFEKNSSGVYGYQHIRMDGSVSTSRSISTKPETLYLAKGDTLRVRSTVEGSSPSIVAGASGNALTIDETPDFSIFSTYGTTELLPATGYSSSGLTNYTTTASQYGDLDSESLPPGEYDLTATATFYSNGATTTDNIGIGLSTTSGNSATGLVEGDTVNYTTKTTTSGSRNTVALSVQGIVVTTPTTYYLKGFAGGSITNLQIGWKWRFRRVK